MALPRKLKNMQCFMNGTSWIGEATSVTLPKLSRKMEDYRAGGMNAPVKIDHGLEALEMEVKCGGLMADAVGQFGTTQLDAVMLRFAGAYQRDDFGDVDSVEVVARGRWQEIDMGDAKPGEDTENTLKASLSFYQLTINGVELVQIDIMNMVERYNGIDVLAAQRAAIGL